MEEKRDIYGFDRYIGLFIITRHYIAPGRLTIAAHTMTETEGANRTRTFLWSLYITT